MSHPLIKMVAWWWRSGTRWRATTRWRVSSTIWMCGRLRSCRWVSWMTRVCGCGSGRWSWIVAAPKSDLIDVVVEVDRRACIAGWGIGSPAGWCRAWGGWSKSESVARMQTARMVVAVPVVGVAMRDLSIGVAQLHELGRAFANPRVGHRLGEIAEIMLDARQQHGVRRLPAPRRVVGTDARRGRRVRTTTRHRMPVAGCRCTWVRTGRGCRASVGTPMVRSCRRSWTGTPTPSTWLIGTKPRPGSATQRAPPICGARAGSGGGMRWCGSSSTPRRPRPTRRHRNRCSTPSAMSARSSVSSASSPPTSASTPTRRRRRRRRDGADDPPGDASADPRRFRCETTSGIALPRSALLATLLYGRTRRVLLDDSGLPVDAGRFRRFFTGRLRDLIMLQATHCPCRWLPDIDRTLPSRPHHRPPTRRTDLDQQRRTAVRGTQPAQEPRLPRLARPRRPLAHLPTRRHRDPTTLTPTRAPPVSRPARRGRPGRCRTPSGWPGTAGRSRP